MIERRASLGTTIVRGAAAGLVGGLALLTLMLLLRTVAGIPTTAELLGDRIAALIPYDIFLQLLGTFGGYNRFKQLGIGGALLGQTGIAVLGGVALAMLARRSDDGADVDRRMWGVGLTTVRVAAGLAVGAWFVLVLALFPNLDTNYFGLTPMVATIVTIISLALLLVVYAAATIFTFGWLSSPRSAEVQPEPAEAGEPTVTVTADLSRRRLLVGGAGVVMAASSAGMLTRLFSQATFSYDGTQYIGANLEPITPNDKFYVVTKNVVDPRVNRTLWGLEVNGHVDSPQHYDFSRIESMTATDQETTLMCISNPIAWGLMSNAVWTGVPMRDLLEEVGVRSGAVEVVLHGADGYSDTFSIEKAMDPTTLVAYGMNGEPLPQRHGFPARIIVPGMYGEKNVKWVTRIEVVTEDAKGFYESQGWGPDFTIPNRSRIDGPGFRNPLQLGDPITLRGIAFAGNRGVESVEVSTDGQRSWNAADITYAGTPLTWSFWEYPWQPDGAGDYELAVRMTDGNGDLQTAERRGTAPQGATGYHIVNATVAA